MNTKDLIDTTIPVDLATLTQCPLCHANGFYMKEKKILGIFPVCSLVCPTCNTTFKKQKNEIYKLVVLTTPTIWQSYGNQTLTSREWLTIGNGGMSDEKQKATDIQQWLQRLSLGTIQVSFAGVRTPVILKPEEKLLFALPHVSMKEPRAVRKTSGGYAGPSFRVAKNVSFRMGRFGSTTESHQEIRNIDQGILTITNQRFVFSGGMKTVSLDLRKIFQIDPFTDGFGLHKEDREKTQYFVLKQDVGSMQLQQDDRSYSEPINGMILKCVMEGAIRNYSKLRR